jgi:hypothetical protein
MISFFLAGLFIIGITWVILGFGIMIVTWENGNFPNKKSLEKTVIMVLLGGPLFWLIGSIAFLVQKVEPKVTEFCKWLVD